MNVVVAIANHYLRIASIRSRHSIGQSPVNRPTRPKWAHLRLNIRVVVK